MLDVPNISMPQPSNHLDALLQQGQKKAAGASPELKKAFEDFVGQTFFNQMLGSMRSTQEKPAYFHGGRTEEVFQGQLDQMMAENLSEKTAETFAAPMFDLYMLSRP